jgi:hypothetical protein
MLLLFLENLLGVHIVNLYNSSLRCRFVAPTVVVLYTLCSVVLKLLLGNVGRGRGSAIGLLSRWQGKVSS